VLGGGQLARGAVAAVDAVLLDPAAQGLGADPEVSGGLADRLAGANQRDGVTAELGRVGDLRPNGDSLL